MPRTTKLHKPQPHFSELTLALYQMRPHARDAAYVALMRFATDEGWDDGARGFAVLLCGILEGLRDGKPLSTLTQELDDIEARCKDGNLAWFIREVDREKL